MTALPAHIAGAITRFDAAAQALGEMQAGSQPDNWWSIVHRYEEAKVKLECAIHKAILK